MRLRGYCWIKNAGSEAMIRQSKVVLPASQASYLKPINLFEAYRWKRFERYAQKIRYVEKNTVYWMGS